MSVQITTAFVQQYSTNIAFLLQQQGSRLRSAVTEQAFTGKAATFVEQFGSVTPVKNLARNSDTPVSDVPQDRRWVYPLDYDWATLIDQQDRLRLLIDPAGPYTTAGMMAMGRAQDDAIIDGFFNNNYTGETGTTNVGHLAAYGSASQVVPIGTGSTAATGLNVAKLRYAKRLLMAAEVDDSEQFYIAITALQHDNMLNEIQATSMEFQDKPVLLDGKITRFMGFNFIHSERIPGGASYAGTLVAGTEVTSANYLVPCWAKSGMALGMWNDIVAAVDLRADKRRSWQVYVTGTFGGTRLEEKRNVIIPCT